MSSQNVLARGVPLPDSQPSPSEELHHTIKKLLDENSQLKEQVEELEGDKRHFQRKLDEYIRFDIDERASSSASASGAPKVGDKIALQKEIQFLKRENVRLNSTLSSKGGSGPGMGNYRFSERENNPVVLHQLSELRAARSLCVEQHERKMEALKLENFRLKEEMERLRRTLQLTESANVEIKRSSWEALNGNIFATGEGGYSSLPETLPSFSSGHSAFHAGMPSSNITGAEDPLAVEVKRLKKQLEKYKTVNIELDQKLKESNLELRRHTEGQGNWNVAQQMDIEKLEGDVSRLRAQLDQALGENNHLRSMAGRQMY